MAWQHDSEFSPPSESDINIARCRAVKRLCARYQPADAEDIVHTAFLQFFHDPAAQGSYWQFVLKRDLLNAEAAFVRRKRGAEKQVLWQDQLTDTDESESRADFVDLAEKIEVTATTQYLTLESPRDEPNADMLLNAVMRDLHSERERTVLKGLYEGLSSAEIAHELGEKQETIRKQAQRLRAKLRDHPLVQELRGK